MSNSALKAHERLMLLLRQRVTTHRWDSKEHEKQQGYRRTPDEHARIAERLRAMELEGMTRRAMIRALRCHHETIVKHLGPGKIGRKPRR